MTPGQLEKGNELARKIALAKEMIKRAKYSQAENIVARASYWTFNGNSLIIDVPPSLFKTIGKLILSELNQQVIEWQKELDEL